MWEDSLVPICNASEGGIAYADAFERSSIFHAAASFFVLRRNPPVGGFLSAYADAFERSSTFHAAASFFVLRRDPFTGGFLSAYL